MAKIRVYELARDLNMTNKELLEKIQEMDIPVSNHMSSLDDAMVDQVRSTVLGKKDVDLVEKRVKPTVIRRRKKVAKPKPAAVEAKAPEAKPAPEKTPVKTVEPEAEKPAKKPVKKVKKKKSVSESAKIVSKPVDKKEEKKKAEAEAAALKKATEKPEPVEVKPDKTVDAQIPEEKITEPVQQAEEKAAPPPAADAAPAEKPAAEEKPADKEKAKKEKPAPKAKKGKKDTPAKIIKRAPVGKPVAAKPEKQKSKQRPKPGYRKPAPVSAQKPQEPDGGAKDKKKGWKKKEAEPGKKRPFKKKSTFRKKEIVEGAALYSGKGRGRRGKKGPRGKRFATGQKTQITVAKAIKRRVKIDDTIVLSELAKRMGIKANEMIAKLMGLGVMATVNQTIEFDTAALVAAEFDYEVERATFEEEVFLKKTQEEDPDKLSPRPPVVTIMGHVDHGKTSLLDVIRKTRVTDGEAGGITQHIGAYNVETDKGVIAFLDTPGHEAFSAMRSRGARVTDIVVLVVAADDGVMPQTIEAINHSKASEVPIIVAVNKMDKPEADPDRVYRELTEHDMMPEDWGGETIFVKVSAKKNEGIDDLLDMILLQSEMLELKANPDKKAEGHVVEAKLDSGRGPLATILVQNGTLRTGDPIVCGMHYGKIRALYNDRGEKVDMAGPSMPVEIIGLSGVPMAGDEMVALEDEKDAKQVSLHRVQKQRSKELAKTNRLSLEGLFERMQQGEVKDLNIIIKADVDGSIEALKDSLVKLSNEEVNINVVHSATGTITESDISLAAVSDAIIIGFNVRPNTKVQEQAAEENVDMRFHNVIYNVIKEVKDAIVGMMESTFEERVLGRADVRQVFHVPKIGAIAGSYVTDGKMVRGQLMRLLRDGIIIYEGKNGSLRRFKDDVKEVQGGYECGIGIENYNDIKVGDVIEAYYLEEIRPQMD